MSPLLTQTAHGSRQDLERTTCIVVVIVFDFSVVFVGIGFVIGRRDIRAGISNYQVTLALENKRLALITKTTLITKRYF